MTIQEMSQKPIVRVQTVSKAAVKSKYLFVFVTTNEVRECLLLFGAESSVIQIAVQKFEDQDI